MLRRFAVTALIVLAFSTPAMADATADARAAGEAFGKALAACDQSAIESLYEDNAVAIYPGLGEEAKGKAAIGKMAIGVCKTQIGKQVSSEARKVGADYIVNIGRWRPGRRDPTENLRRWSSARPSCCTKARTASGGTSSIMRRSARLRRRQRRRSRCVRRG